MTAMRICERHGQPFTDHCPRCRAHYDHAHRAERLAWLDIVNTGTCPCARDRSHTIDPTQPWHLDHLDDGTRAPSCARHNIAATRNITP
jgi:hypothetical protein